MVSDIRAPESEGSLLNPILAMGPIEGKTQTLDPGRSVAGVPFHSAVYLGTTEALLSI